MTNDISDLVFDMADSCLLMIAKDLDIFDGLDENDGVAERRAINNYNRFLLRYGISGPDLMEIDERYESDHLFRGQRLEKFVEGVICRYKSERGLDSSNQSNW